MKRACDVGVAYTRRQQQHKKHQYVRWCWFRFWFVCFCIHKYYININSIVYPVVRCTRVTIKSIKRHIQNRPYMDRVAYTIQYTESRIYIYCWFEMLCIMRLFVWKTIAIQYIQIYRYRYM